MTTKSNLVRIYSGTELTVGLLKELLEISGIPCIIQNDFNSGIMAGFSGGSASSIDLFIQEPDLDKAAPIVNEFIETNMSE